MLRPGARVRTALGPLAALLLASAAADVLAAEEGAVLRLRAEQLASEGRCEEALPVVRRARNLDPDDARAALLEGECAIRVLRYGEALAPLEDARRLDPDLDVATLDLGIAHFQLGDYEAAARELEVAVERVPDRAEAQLFYGLVLLQRADAEAAAAAFEQAQSLDPTGTGAAATYFAGRAWQVAEDRERARRSLERVQELAPDSVWAAEADRALAASRSRYARRGPWIRFTAGMEWDDNVVLRGDGVLAISGKRDGRGVWYGRSGIELFRDESWAVGLLGRYYGNAHIDLKDFDTNFPIVSPYIDRNLNEKTYLRLQPEFGYAWLDGDDFLLTTGVTPSLHRSWGDFGLGRAHFRFEYRDYRFRIFVPAQDRDGFNYIGGYDHVFFPFDGSEVQLGFGVNHYDSDSGEYDYTAPEVRFGGRQELPFQSAFDLDLRYRHEVYENRSFFSPTGRRRDDDVVLLSLVLEKRLSENLLVSARYAYQMNDSKVEVFDYDRNIIGGFVTVELGTP